MAYIEAPVFYPTKQDMEQSFEKYIESIEVTPDFIGNQDTSTTSMLG
jgi:hypothetical protein